MSKDKYIKAEALPVLISDIELDGIRIIETGEYRMNQSQILEPIGENRNWITKTVTLPSSRQKDLEALQRKGLSMLPIRVQYERSGTVRRAVTWSLSDARIVWRHFDRKGNQMAEALIDLLSEDSLQDRWEQVWDERRTEEERHADDNRIMQQNAPYYALYQKKICDRAFSWFGTNFYWSYFYFWMSRQERCDLDNRNPPINGRRKTKIHQWIEPETKERLRDKAIELGALILAARSKQQFIELFQNRYGEGWQKDIFD